MAEIGEGAKYISELTSTNSLADTDVLVIDDGSHNYKITWAAFKALLGTVASISADANGKITITLTNGQSVSCTPHDSTKQDVLTFDNAPTAGSNNPVKSGGIKIALDAKLNTTDYVQFVGATGSGAGSAGIVPAPAEQGLYLSSDGAWEAPDTTPTANSGKLITSGAVKNAIDNVEIDVDSAMSDSSENPVQNKVVTGKMKSTAKADKIYHLGFYLDANGDLSYDY